VYLCGVCGSGDHLNAGCPHKALHPQVHGSIEDNREVEEDDVAPDVWAALAPNLPGYIPPVNPPMGDPGAPGGEVAPAGFSGSFEPPPGFPPDGMTYYTEFGARFHLYNDCRTLERSSLVLRDPFHELDPVGLNLTCCQKCANRWRHPPQR
jgi:hypothetical protein